MLEAKGATDPGVARAESIRYSGENALMNLVHCPDNETAAVEELTQLLGSRCAFQLQRLARSPSDTVRRLTVESLGDSLPVCSGWDALSVPLIVNKLRLRFVQRMAIFAPPSDVVLSALTDVGSALRSERDQIVQMATSAGRASVARAHNRTIHGCLVDVAQQMKKPAVDRALLGLTASLLGSQDDWRGTLAATRASGTYISNTEKAALELDTFVS